MFVLDAMIDDRPVEQAPDHLRRSRTTSAIALVLLLTSAWLPWWLVRYESQGVRYEQVAVGLFSPQAPVSTNVPYLTALLVLGVAMWVFIRVAGRSIVYEPEAWSRDLWIQTGLVAAALVSCLFWPDQVPAFWGGRTYALVNASGSFSETALPGLGFWCAVVGFLLLFAAAWMGRVPRVRQ